MLTKEMKESGIEWMGEIPKSWDLKRMKHILKERKIKNDPIITEEILSLSVERGVFPYSEKTGGGNKAKGDLTAYKVAFPDDIVINSMNILAGAVGLSKYKGAVSPVYYTLYDDSGEIEINYYYYLFKTEAFQRSLLGLGNGIMMKESSTGKLNTIRMRIPMQKLFALRLPFPPKNVQTKIVEYVSAKVGSVDKIITETRQSIEELKKYKQSTITETVTKGLYSNVEMKDSGVEWIGEIPVNWSLTKFGRISSINANLVKPNDYLDVQQVSPDDIEKSSGKLIKFKTVRESGVISNNYAFVKGQILYSKIRPKLNKVVIAPFDGLCSADMYPIDTKENSEFVLFLMMSYYFLHQVSIVTTDRVKMPKINQNELANILIALPSKIEQGQIVTYLEKQINKIDNLIQDKEKAIDELEKYKQSLIYEFVTGKKEV